MFATRGLLALRGLFLLTSIAAIGAARAQAGEAASDARVALKVPSQFSPSDLPPGREPANLDEDKAEREHQVALRTVTLMNYSGMAFTYRLARTSGPTWTEPYVLPSKMIHRFMADNINEPSVIRTLNPFGKSGYAFISYKVANGWEVFKILTNSSYAYVENTNGYGELVDPSMAQPLARVKGGEERKIIELLRANHCYFSFDDIQTNLKSIK